MSKQTSSVGTAAAGTQSATKNSVDTNRSSQYQDRGVPEPKLGPQGKDMNKEESKRPGRRGAVHTSQDDPFSILDNNQPYHEMLEQLRDSFIVYKENCSRCKIQLRAKCKSRPSYSIITLAILILFEFKISRGRRAI